MTTPAVGQIYAFRTAPFNAFSPPQTGRYAAFKVLGIFEERVAVAILEGIWPKLPGLQEAADCGVLHEHRFSWSGRLAIMGVFLEWWQPKNLPECGLLGTMPLSAEERSCADVVRGSWIGISLCPLSVAVRSAESEWRWAHDRAAVMAEYEQKKAVDEAARTAKAERYRNRLSKLTWEQLLLETPFERWTTSPTFPPEDFTAAARSVVRQACMELRDLGAKPRKADVRKVLKATVEWFNAAGAEAGDVIETEEREDICAVLEEMAYVARHKTLVDEIDQWREW